MTIEVRELVIRSQVLSAPKPAQQGAWTAQDQAQLKDELLAECRRMLEQQLRQRRER